MAFLSVIIAAHNAEATLHATLSSLLAATDQDTEVIIFNDSSEDATQAIIEEWSPKFPQIITRTVNFRNVGRVRNSAVALASGEYITMLDSDDCLKPGSLRDAMAYLKAQRPDMLLTRLLEIRDPRRMTSDWQGFNPVPLSQHEAITRFLRHKDFQAHLIGQFIHRSLYEKNPIPPMLCYEDFAVFPGMLMQSSKIAYQRQGHYYYIKRPTVCRAVWTPAKFQRLSNARYRWKEHFRHATNISSIATGLIFTATIGNILQVSSSKPLSHE